MVHVRVSWGHASGIDSSMPMHDSPPNNELSLSATRSTANNGLPEKGPVDDICINSVSELSSKSSEKPAASNSQKVAARAAKKEICEKVRDDWTWPLPSSELETARSELDDRREWRERESDSEYVPASPILNTDPYRFDGPDCIARPEITRKRRRQMLLEEEMQWNDGLRTFHGRRNAWTGARIQSASPPPEDDSPASQPPIKPNESTHPPSPPSPHPDTRPCSPSSSTTLVPSAPPILPPSNPIRASIHPAIYSSIYEKIVIRGLSPTIPINLKDVVHALVAGWKKDGEWPPKSEAGKVGATEEMRAKGEGRRLARMKRALGLGRGIDGPGRGEGVRDE